VGNSAVDQSVVAVCDILAFSCCSVCSLYDQMHSRFRSDLRRVVYWRTRGLDIDS